MQAAVVSVMSDDLALIVDTHWNGTATVGGCGGIVDGRVSAMAVEKSMGGSATIIIITNHLAQIVDASCEGPLVGAVPRQGIV